MAVLEICVDSVESAIAAEKGGADRAELCGNLIIGGTTPALALFSEIKKCCSIPLRVLIRPRFGDFCYSEYEKNIIREEIRQFREAGANAVVIGALTKEGNVDMPAMESFVKEAGNMEITFHRAFDVCRDPYEALENIIQLGIGTLLTSGQKNTCWEGRTLLRALMEQAGNRLTIMPGAGVNPENLEKLIPFLRAQAYHASGKTVRESAMVYRKQEVSMGLPAFSEYEIYETSQDAVRKMSALIKKTKIS